MLKKIILSFLTSILLLTVNAQIVPKIIWDKNLGTGYGDIGNTIQQTFDNGYITAGYNNFVDYYGLIYKLNDTGGIVWTKTIYPVNHLTAPNKVCFAIQTRDSNYVVAATKRYTNDKGKYWVLKLDQAGNTIWEKEYGLDWFFSGCTGIKQTYDGGYIITGMTNGNVPGAHGMLDFYVVKINDTGLVEWDHAYGGTNDDYPFDIVQAKDSGYVIVGGTESFDGDVTDNDGGEEIWVVKTDTVGTIEWTKTYGGWNQERAFSVFPTYDSGYVIAGYTESDTGDVVGGFPGPDAWILKLDPQGALQWQKPLGGTSNDRAHCILQTPDSGYIVACESYSSDGDKTCANGYVDYWIVKLDDTAAIEWEKTLGGSYENRCYAVNLTNDSGYILTGFTNSLNGNVTGPPLGGDDIWIVKLADTMTNVCDSIAPVNVKQTNRASLSIYPNPTDGKINILIPDHYTGVSIKVLNMIGQEINIPFSRTTPGYLLNFKSFPKGMYILQVATRQGNFTQKIIYQ